MPKVPGVPHLQAVKAFEKAGFKVVREGKHIVMSDGRRILTIPRHNPVNAYTLGGLVQDAGLTVEQFKKLLSDWESLEAIQAFAGSRIDSAVVPPLVQGLMVGYDTKVAHYEIADTFEPGLSK